MNRVSRRDFVRQGILGLGALGAAGWVLRADAQPTETSGDLGLYNKFLQNDNRRGQNAQPQAPVNWACTLENIIGPYYRSGAPFRAKVTPPLEPFTVFVISGRVWGFDTRKPLVPAVLDVWQANAEGRYDNDDTKNLPARDVFRYRARMVTDETGYYEFETVHPAPAKVGPDAGRPSHIHFLVRHPGYKTLVTQLYFKGDAHN